MARQHKPVLGILLQFGFHGLKKWIHSGFYEKAVEYFDIKWLCVDKNNDEYLKNFELEGTQIVKFDSYLFRDRITKLESHNNSVRLNWQINKKTGVFANYRILNVNYIKGKLIGNSIFKTIFEKITLRQIESSYYSNEIEQILKTQCIDHLLATTLDSIFCKSIYISSYNLNIKKWYLVNSWKDLYINDFIPFRRLFGAFFWSNSMMENYISRTSALKNTKKNISGNPSFDALFNHKCTQKKSFYCEKYSIDQDSIWIMYTMMPPGINNDEIETVLMIAENILKQYKKSEVVILLRRNPNHEVNDFVHLSLPENIVLLNHYCTYDKKKDLIVQTSEGEKEWLDLLNYTSINISVPSTVTLEFCLLEKPVINIRFGKDGNRNELLDQHFEAGFYKEILNSNKLVQKVDVFDDFMDLFESTLNTNKGNLNNQKIQKKQLASDVVINSIIGS